MRLPDQPLFNKISQYVSQQGGKNFCLFLLGSQAGLRVSEAVSFDYQSKHPRHRDLYLVKGKGNKKRYVYVSKEIIQELKSNHWKPNQTNRINFYHFLQKTKKELNIGSEIELTPHTLRRCFTTHNALNGVPIPVLQKALGHANIRTTSCYWRGSVDIREFGEWLKPQNDQPAPEETSETKIKDNSPKEPEILTKLEAQITSPLPNRELEPKNKKIFSLNHKNQKLKETNQKKIKQLVGYRERVRDSSTKNNSLIVKYTKLNNSAKIKKVLLESNPQKLKERKNQEKFFSTGKQLPVISKKGQSDQKEQFLLERIKQLEKELFQVQAENNNLTNQLAKSDQTKFSDEQEKKELAVKLADSEKLIQTEKQRADHYQQQLKFIAKSLYQWKKINYYKKLEQEQKDQEVKIEQSLPLKVRN